MPSLIKEIARKTGLLWGYRLIFHTRREYLRKKDVERYKTTVNGGYFCIGCGKYWSGFKPLDPGFFGTLKKYGWRYEPDQFETLNYNNYTCYGCTMTDRSRLYAMYLADVISPKDPLSILDFAPSKPLSDFIRTFKNVKYRTSDLFMEAVDDKLDIQDLYKYEDERFDIFICSHILEHVNNDIKAMQELYRVTKKGGWGIAMVPIINTIEITHEDPGIKDEKLRMKYFGQSDHVRLYAKENFIERLKNAGFGVKLLDVSYFGREAFEKNGISLTSILYIAYK
jgi:predicted SAM-dependent methyltransferase